MTSIISSSHSCRFSLGVFLVLLTLRRLLSSHHYLSPWNKRRAAKRRLNPVSERMTFRLLMLLWSLSRWGSCKSLWWWWRARHERRMEEKSESENWRLSLHYERVLSSAKKVKMTTWFARRQKIFLRLVASRGSFFPFLFSKDSRQLSECRAQVNDYDTA